MMLRVHHFTPQSFVNGPGPRAVIWVQGCKLNCAGCFNRDTHDADMGVDVAPSDIADIVNELSVRGITLTGGEPLHQPKPIVELLAALNPDKDVLLYSGYSIDEAMKSPDRRSVLLKCDAALMGRYRLDAPHPYDNKKLIIRTDRIKPAELKPHRRVEVIFSGDEGIITGFPRI